MTYIVPQVSNVFANSHKALPWLTAMMLSISSIVRTWWWLGVLGLIAMTTALTLGYRSIVTRIHLDKWFLKLPILGDISRNYNAARFSSTFGLMLLSGVPVLKALDTSAATVSNYFLRQQLMNTVSDVREGVSLAQAFTRTNALPPLVVMFVRLGEQTGRLPNMLNRVAHQLSQEVQRKALSFATLLEPLLIVAMGFMVMAIVLSVLMPIMQLNTMVK